MAPRKPKPHASAEAPAGALGSAIAIIRDAPRAIAYRDPRDLKPSPWNARLHPPAQRRQIGAIIREVGFNEPVVIDEADTILAGHGRVATAIEDLKLALVPTITIAGLSDEQKRAYILASNKLTLNSEWDDERLKAELAALAATDVNLELTGFSDAELAKLLHVDGEGLTDPDAVPEHGGPTVTVRGDVWLLGRHRLVCGDSTVADDVAKALAGVTPHLMVTDPPYGVKYAADWRDDALGGKKGGRATAVVKNDDKANWAEAWSLFEGDVVYIWQGDKQITDMAQQLALAGFECRNLIIWAKSQFVIGRGDYHPMHETCWYAVRKGKTGHWAGDRKQTTLWEIAKPSKSDTGHSTQKPVECMRRPILNNSSPGQAVYEPFAGSGTTIIACEGTGRACHALEIDPAHVDRAILRWQQHTGLAATLEPASPDETPRTFVELMAERAPQTPLGLAGQEDAQCSSS